MNESKNDYYLPEVNRVAIAGTLMHDPPLRWTKKGVPVTNFIISTVPDTTLSFQDESERESCYVSIVVWANQAIQCNKYLKKGHSVLILGELQSMPNLDLKCEDYPIQVNAQWIQYLEKDITKFESSY
ncbi:single-stranded DNA-binding protein [candidate division KSB1 bacterium]|nr:single-stranded DNA-binding protein [candidate division KSB1 bacterium]